MTIREMVKEIQDELRQGDPTPGDAARFDLRLSALLGNCLTEIREADMAYAHVLLGYLQSEHKSSHAKIKAETSPEAARLREARDTKALVIEMLRAVRHFGRAVSEEARLSR